MRKIIWTIGAVFCVQIAFQLAMTADRSNGEYAALRTPLQNGIDTSAPAADTDVFDTDIAPAAPEIERSPIRTRVLIRYVVVHGSPRQAAAPTTTAFKPIVITYDRTGALTDATNTAPRHQRTERPGHQPDDKRSLLAKVVTKPYDWLKVVGSKLH